MKLHFYNFKYKKHGINFPIGIYSKRFEILWWTNDGWDIHICTPIVCYRNKWGKYCVGYKIGFRFKTMD